MKLAPKQGKKLFSWPFYQMYVGDWFDVPEERANSCRARASDLKRQWGVKFVVQKDYENHYTCTRVR